VASRYLWQPLTDSLSLGVAVRTIPVFSVQFTGSCLLASAA
jgi:hypothetical protein